MTRYVSLRIPDDLADALDSEARRLDRSRTWVIVRALRSSLPAGEEGTNKNSGGSRASSPAGAGEGMNRRRLKSGSGGGDEPTLPRA